MWVLLAAVGSNVVRSYSDESLEDVQAELRRQVDYMSNTDDHGLQAELDDDEMGGTATLVVDGKTTVMRYDIVDEAYLQIDRSIRQ